MVLKNLIQIMCYFCQYVAVGVAGIGFVIGINSDEFIGNFYLGIFVASFFIVLMVFCSAFISELLFNKARFIWVCFSLIILLTTLACVFFIENGRNTSDIAIAMGIPMTILSMPSGIFGMFFYGKLDLFQFEIIYVDIVVGWVLFFVAGYIQWFFIYLKLVKLFYTNKGN